MRGGVISLWRLVVGVRVLNLRWGLCGLLVLFDVVDAMACLALIRGKTWGSILSDDGFDSGTGIKTGD